MKKFRGKRRYYQNLRKGTDTFCIDVNTWYDHWHTHVDWDGRGTINKKHRKEHLKELFIRMEKACIQFQSCNNPYQIWAIIYEKESYYDAIFVHTPNPNEDNFPCKFADIQWGEKIPSFLVGMIEPMRYQISTRIRDIYGDDFIYYIRLKDDFENI